MTIREAIMRTDALKHNTYTDAEKIQWLSALDAMVRAQILDTHEGPPAAWSPYDPDTDRDQPLLIGDPFSDIYLRWLEAQIDYANGEYDRYNNSMAMYQALWDACVNHYNRSHMPKTGIIRYF